MLDRAGDPECRHSGQRDRDMKEKGTYCKDWKRELGSGEVGGKLRFGLQAGNSWAPRKGIGETRGCR